MDLSFAINLITGAEPCEDEVLRDQAASDVYRVLLQIAGRHGQGIAPEDLAQHAIVHILDCGVAVEKPKGWLAVVLRNVWFSLLRENQRSPLPQSADRMGSSSSPAEEGAVFRVEDPAVAAESEVDGKEAQDPTSGFPLADDSGLADIIEGWHMLCTRMENVIDDGTAWSVFLAQHEVANDWRPERWTQPALRRAVTLRHATAQEVSDLLSSEKDGRAPEVVEEGVLERARATHARAQYRGIGVLQPGSTGTLSEKPAAFRRNAFSELCARRGRTEQGQGIPNSLGQHAMLPALLLRHANVHELESLREMIASGGSAPEPLKRRIQNRFANRHRLTLGTVDRIARRIITERDIPRAIRLGAAAAAATLWHERSAQLAQFRTYALLFEAAEEAE